jgi:transcriptional regulator with XRE-family HTH domain
MERIKNWREQLGLKDIDVAKAIGTTTSSYYDIELHEDEIFQVTPIGQVKKLCHILQRSLFDLFEVTCDFCTDRVIMKPELHLPRNELIKLRRKANGWSITDLGDRIGFENEAIDAMERDSEFLDGWSFDLIKELAAILDVPITLLLGVKCKQCGN